MKRKLLSIILALALCAGLAVPALAAEKGAFASASFFYEYYVEDKPPYVSGFHIILSGRLEDKDLKISDLDGTTITRDGQAVPFEISYYYVYNVKADPRNETEVEVRGTTLSEPGEYVLNIVYKGTSYSSASRMVIGSDQHVTEKPSTWADEQVRSAIAAGLVPEALQSKYTRAVTRAEFCAFAVTLYETVTGKEIEGRKTFDDTKDTNVQKAAAIGVVKGVGGNKFSPDANLNREQAATMLSRLADAVGKPLGKQASTFSDISSISTWAIDAVGQVQAAGIMSGVGNNTFSPGGPYTREQSIATILRLYSAVK